MITGQDMICFLNDGGMIAVGALATYLGFKYVNQRITPCKVRNPEDHYFFNNAKKLQIEKLDSFSLFHRNRDCPVRDKLFRDMLNIKIDIWTDHMYRLTCKARKDRMDNETLSRELLSWMRDIVEDYERKWEYEGVPRIVIDKFRSWHSNHESAIVDGMINICRGNFFSSLDEKLNAILTLHNALLLITFSDAEKSLIELNGELSGKEYKGEIIE